MNKWMIEWRPILQWDIKRENIWLNILVSCHCYNKLLQTLYLKTTHLHYLTVMEVTCPKPALLAIIKYRQGMFLLEAPEENLIPCLFQLLEVVHFPRGPVFPLYFNFKTNGIASLNLWPWLPHLHLSLKSTPVITLGPLPYSRVFSLQGPWLNHICKWPLLCI